jgi:ssDNA-binding replication factor A large subunit
MTRYPHITNISMFDATKVVVSEQDTTANPGGGSKSISIAIHGDEGATTVITVWRESGTAVEAPELVVNQ